MSDGKDFSQYAHPERLVSTDWLAEQIADGRVGRPDGVVVVESDEDVLLYDTGHIPGAVKIDWHTDLNDPLTRDYVDGEPFAEGHGPQRASAATRRSCSTATRTTGGRRTPSGCSRCSGTRTSGCSTAGAAKWVAEGRELTRDVPTPSPTEYPVVERDDHRIRAFQDDVLAHLGQPLVDVRSPGEFSGELLHMPDYPQEGAVRGGHIPGAQVVPWARAAAEDGTFKSAPGARGHLRRRAGPRRRRRRRRLLPDRRAVVAHLVRADPPAGVRHVRNYDGSWTEWGNAVRVPIERRPTR